MVPADVALNHTQLFLTRALGPETRVLEVGCGNGQLAWRLAHLGLKVVGLDIALPADRPSHPSLVFEKGDFFQYQAEPFDAVLFTSSLHHLAPLDGAVRRARNLLKPGGQLLVEDFDLAAPDDATLTWYHETQSLLTHAGVLSLDHQHLRSGELHRPHRARQVVGVGGKELAQLRQRWDAEHAHTPALHTGKAMLAALRKVGELAEVSRVAYLYRVLNATLGSSPRDLNVAEWLFATEERRIGHGNLKGVGLRAICRPG